MALSLFILNRPLDASIAARPFKVPVGLGLWYGFARKIFDPVNQKYRTKATAVALGSKPFTTALPRQALSLFILNHPLDASIAARPFKVPVGLGLWYGFARKIFDPVNQKYRTKATAVALGYKPFTTALPRQALSLFILNHPLDASIAARPFKVPVGLGLWYGFARKIFDPVNQKYRTKATAVALGYKPFTTALPRQALSLFILNRPLDASIAARPFKVPVGLGMGSKRRWCRYWKRYWVSIPVGLGMGSKHRHRRHQAVVQVSIPVGLGMGSKQKR